MVFKKNAKTTQLPRVQHRDCHIVGTGAACVKYLCISCLIFTGNVLHTRSCIQHSTPKVIVLFNPLEWRGNDMKLVHWLLMGGLLHLDAPHCTKCNRPPINGQCTVLNTVLLYNGPLLCWCNWH